MINPTSALELENSFGFLKFYGFSPAVDFASFKEQPQHVICYGSCDLRHVLKTVASEHCKMEFGGAKVCFYVPNEHPAILLRNAVILKLIVDKEITLREKSEAILDVYWNIFVTGKSLNLVQKSLLLIEKELSSQTLQFHDLKHLKYKDFDDLMDQLLLWKKAINSNFLKKSDCLPKFLTNRQTALFKERWEARKNIVDGDFIWGLKENHLSIVKTDRKSSLVVHEFKTPPCVQFAEYWNFREHGVAFAVHNAVENHQFMNPTMLTYQPGKSKVDRLNCQVLGFWGDICIGPFATEGFYVDTVEEYDKFYETRNFELFHSSFEIAINNVEKQLKSIENKLNSNELNFSITPFMSTSKKSPAQCPELAKKVDLVYISYATFCQDIQKQIEDLAPVLCDATLVIETPKFLSVVDVKKRGALAQKQTETLEKLQGVTTTRNLDHHIVCKVDKL